MALSEYLPATRTAKKRIKPAGEKGNGNKMEPDTPATGYSG